MNRKHTLPIVLSLACLLLLLLGYLSSPKAGAYRVHATASHANPASAPVIIHTPLFFVNNVAWSPDGKRIAIANQDGIFQVWDAATGQLVSTHYDSERSLNTFVLGWSADNTRIISTGNHGSTQVWQAATGNTLFTFSAGPPLAASHDGKHVIGGGSSPGTLLVWDTSTGKQILTIQTQTSQVNAVQWSPNDQLFAAATAKQLSGGSIDYIIQAWNATTGKLISTYHSPAHGMIDSFSWSPDSRRIVTASGFNPNVSEQIWDTATGMPLLSYHGNPGAGSSLAWSPDGKHIASWSNSDLTVLVWDPATGKSNFTFGSNQPVTSGTWLPNGKGLVVIGLKMQVLDAATGQPVLTYSNASNQTSVTASADGKHLASAATSGTSVWDTGADHLIAFVAARHQQENAVTWSPDGTQIAAEDGSTFDVGFWNAITGASIGDLTIYHEQLGRFSYENKTTVAWSPDGAHVAEAGKRLSVIVWGNQPVICDSSACVALGGDHTAQITSVAWSPDGKLIASASLDKTVLIYDLANQKNLLTYRGHTAGVTTVAWSPDGKHVASGSADKTVQVWDATTGARQLLLSGHTDTVTSVAWSPDGTRLASASLDGTVRIWDVVHGSLLLTYHGHTGAVTAVAWSPDGRRIASAGADKTVQVWDAITGMRVFTYRGHTDAVMSVAWSHDGTRLASASKDGTLQIFAAPLPVTDISCPAPGTARPAIMTPLTLGSHQNIVYVYNQGSPAMAFLRRFDVVTGTKTNIVASANVTFHDAQVSTDGQFILFTSQVSGNPALQLVRLDGQELQTLYCAGKVNGIPPFIKELVWSPNQQSAVFEEANPGGGPGAPIVQLLDLGKGTIQTKITPTTRFGYHLSQWFNNTLVYMTGNDSNGAGLPHDVFVLDTSKAANQNGQIVLVATVTGLHWEINLTTDGKELLIDQCATGLSLDQLLAPSIISGQPARGGTLAIIYASHVHAVTQLRVSSATGLLFVIGGKTSADPQGGLWQINLDGTGLRQLTPDGLELSSTHTTWATTSRDGSLYAVAGFVLQGPSNQFPVKLLYGSLSGGAATVFATTLAGEEAFIAGWTTF